MSKFKVGDRVLAMDNVAVHETPAPGTITELYRPVPVEGVYDYLVVYDDRPGIPLWSNVTGLIKPEKHPVIVITTDGKTTTATKRLGKRVLATATARCNPADKFFFDTGAALAFARLVGAEVKFADEAEEEKPKQFRVVCTDIIGDVGKSYFRVGKIYDARKIVNTPCVKDDHGEPHTGEHTSATDIRVDLGFGAVYFIPLVED